MSVITLLLMCHFNFSRLIANSWHMPRCLPASHHAQWSSLWYSCYRRSRIRWHVSSSISLKGHMSLRRSSTPQGRHNGAWIKPKINSIRCSPPQRLLSLHPSAWTQLSGLVLHRCVEGVRWDPTLPHFLAKYFKYLVHLLKKLRYVLFSPKTQEASHFVLCPRLSHVSGNLDHKRCGSSTVIETGRENFF